MSLRPLSDPPHDCEAERAVIGSALMDNRCLDDLFGIVRSNDFFVDQNRKLFSILELLHATRQPVDVTILTSHLRSTNEINNIGTPYIAKLTSAVSSPANATHYAEIVSERARSRRLIAACNSAIQDAYEGKDSKAVAAQLAEELDHIDDASRNREIQTLAAASKTLLERIDNPKTGTLVSSGVACIDHWYGGFRSGGSYVIAARPGDGKSAIMKQICSNVDLRNKAALVVSLEMERYEIAGRILSQRSEIDSKSFEVSENGQNPLTDGEKERLHDEVNRAKSSRLLLHSPIGQQATMRGIAASARIMKAKHDISILAIDYLQLIEKTNLRATDYEHVTECSKACKRIARELGIVVLVLSQLNRANETGGKVRPPRLSDLRDSGSIEQDADGVIALHRTSLNDFKLIVLKWRNDRPGSFDVRFNGELTRFEEPTISPHHEFDDRNYKDI